MKLIIQIPCYNEAAHLAETVGSLPTEIEGIDQIEVLIIDDGSTDGTADVARALGVNHLVRHRRNRGLAAAFQTGLDACLIAGADIIINTDADNQYEAADMCRLVEPVLRGEADIVVGDRQVAKNDWLSPSKKLLQKIGSRVVQHLAGVEIPDAVSGFRAMTREAAMQINIVSRFSYTTEMLILAGRRRMAVASVPVRTNAPVRDSRLFNTVPQFIVNTGVTMLRAYALYNPLRTFVLLGGSTSVVGLIPVIRFLYYYLTQGGSGHIQSLVIGGTLMVIGFVCLLFGIIADLIGRNRQMLEIILLRLKQHNEAELVRQSEGAQTNGFEHPQETGRPKDRHP